MTNRNRPEPRVVFGEEENGKGDDVVWEYDGHLYRTWILAREALVRQPFRPSLQEIHDSVLAEAAAALLPTEDV